MSYKEVSYLSEIHIHQGISSVELARKLSVTKSAVSQIMAKMIKKGYVEKRKSNVDGREYNLYLSEKIEKIYEKNDDALNLIFDESLSSISIDEKKMLCALLIKINENL